MKVVSPGAGSHSFKFIPRVYTLDNTTLQLINEGTKEATELTNHIIAGDDGILNLVFTFTFVEGERYKINLFTQTDDIYRGQILVTSQDPQEYNVSKNYIQYE